MASPIILSELKIGVVGVNPSLWFLQTDLTNAQLQAAGVLASTNPRPNAGDFVLANASDGPEYYVVSSSLTLVAAGGTTGGGFNLVNVFFVASNGDDDNAGTNSDNPLQTISAAINKIAALPDVTTQCIINVMDAAAYSNGTSGFTFPTNSNVFLNAPGARLSTAGTTGLLRGTGGSLKVVCATLSAPSQRLITFGGGAFVVVEALSLTGNIDNDSGSGAALSINSGLSIIGNIAAGVDRSTIIRAETITGNIAETSASATSYKMGIFATTVTGNISSTQTSIYGQVFNTGGSVAGVKRGIFGGNMYGITEVDTGSVGLTLTSADGSYTMPSGDGTNLQSPQTDGSGTVTWVTLAGP